MGFQATNPHHTSIIAHFCKKVNTFYAFYKKLNTRPRKAPKDLLKKALARRILLMYNKAMRGGKISKIPKIFKQFMLAGLLLSSFCLFCIYNDQPASAIPHYVLDINTYKLKLKIGDSWNNDMDLDIETTPDGTFMVKRQSIKVETDAPQGATVVVQALYPDFRTPGSDSVKHIQPVASSPGLPAPLGMDSWGLAVPSEYAYVPDMFSENALYEESSESAVFINPQHFATIYRGESATFPIYYGFNISDATPNGLYYQSFVYTAYVLESDMPEQQASVRPSVIHQSNVSVPITIDTSFKRHENGFYDNDNFRVTIDGRECTNLTTEMSYTNSGQLLIKCNAPPKDEVGLGAKTVQIYYPKHNPIITLEKVIHYIDEDNPLLQGFTEEQCEQMQEHETRHFKDSRDNQIYSVTKLKDGKCWMTDNLRLKLDTNTILTPDDTDIQSTWTPPSNTDVYEAQESESGYNGSGPVWYSSDYNGPFAARSIYIPARIHEDGVYYNHLAATADSSSNINTKGKNAPHSICPKGWRLPTGGDNAQHSEVKRLAELYAHPQGRLTKHKLLYPPASFVIARLYLGSIGKIDDWSYREGLIWTSTIENRQDAKMLIYYLQGKAAPEYVSSDIGRFNYGLSVRCVLRTKPSHVEHIETMQDFTPKMCQNMTTHQSATLRDIRDNEDYTIVKLKDGRCWMSQNLRLKLNRATILTPEDTDILSNWATPRSTEDAPGQRWSEDVEGANTVRSTYRQSSYRTEGVYYTHSAATAQYSNRLKTDGDESLESICPKGWRLPQSSKNYDTSNLPRNDFYDMAVKYVNNNWYSGIYNGAHTLFSTGPDFMKSGYYGYYSGAVSDVALLGFWWSSTVKSSTESYSMKAEDNVIDTIDDRIRYYGFNVRCVAREPATKISHISTMQEFSPQICQNMNTGDTATLRDIRDEQHYTVAKLEDGRCWMTENLRLKLNNTTTLTPNDTDLIANWTPPRSTQVSSESGGAYNWGYTESWANDAEGQKTVRSAYVPSQYNNAGVFYTHSAATAQSSNALNTVGQDAPESVCPKGWRLPTGSSIPGQGEYWQLSDKYKGSAVWRDGGVKLVGSNLLKQPKPSFINYGNFNSDGSFFFSSINQASIGLWWSSTVESDQKAFSLTKLHTDLIPNAPTQRSVASSIRCIAR